MSLTVLVRLNFVYICVCAFVAILKALNVCKWASWIL